MRQLRLLRTPALVVTAAASSLALFTVPAQSATGTPSTDTAYAYTARLDIGDTTRGCSGVLIDPEWLLTAASCFADDPTQGLAVPAGVPRLATTAVIGRADLTGTQGAERRVVQLVPRADRDVVLARLNRPVAEVVPVALAGTPATVGEHLTFAGYGRTHDEWAPLQLHTGTYAVDGTDATSASVTGQNASACMGDAGGPVVRTSGGTAALVSLVSRSFQGGCFGSDATETRTGGITSRVDDLGGWVAATVGATSVTDFDGDGVRDIAVSDPKATVAGHAGAGVVRIVYGGGRGTAEINQDLDWVSGSSEAGDAFGETMDTVDYNEDGYTDLVVGIPSEDMGAAAVADAGMVDVLYGGPEGLGTGALKETHVEEGTDTAVGGTPEAGDRLGQALSAGRTAAGEPYLLVGVPGESLGTITKAGCALYIRGGKVVTISQDTPGVEGDAEANDGFGASVTGDGRHFAIGAPNENIDGFAASGYVLAFDHQLGSDGRPTFLFGLAQNEDDVSGDAESGDEWGASLAMTDFHPAGQADATETILAVGSPGESLAIGSGPQVVGTGRVVTFRVDAAGHYTQANTYWQGAADDTVEGTAEAEDHFGATVAVMNSAPRAEGTSATLRLAVGVPDESVGAIGGAGAIQSFSLLGAPGDADVWIVPGEAGLPGPGGTNQYVGRSIAFTGTSLYVGMPYGPSPYGSVHVLPWSNVTGGTVEPVTTYQPGTGGLPANGARFGSVVR